MEEFVEASNFGRAQRATVATDGNATSSRSHAAMLLRLVDAGTKEPRGKFSLIDLAGAERGEDHGSASKATQREGRAINQSLLALKEVIRARALGRKHAPFRQSRLTQVLEESLTGATCHTTVVGCVSPAAHDLQATVNTLRYAESLHPHPHGRKVKPKPNKAARAAAAAEESQLAAVRARLDEVRRANEAEEAKHAGALEARRAKLAAQQAAADAAAAEVAALEKVVPLAVCRYVEDSSAPPLSVDEVE